MIAREIMTTDVATVSPETPAGEVASLMVERRAEGVPVVDGEGQLLGLITPDAFLRLLMPNRVRFLDVDLYLAPRRLHQELLREIAGLRAADIMIRSLPTVAQDAPLDQVIGLLGQPGVGQVPVVDGGRLVGIIQRMDVVRLFGGRTPGSGPAPSPSAPEEEGP